MPALRHGECVFGPAADTDADGRFEIELTRGGPACLEIRAEGRATLETAHLQPGQSVQIGMQRPTTLCVRAVDRHGAPVRGLKVRVVQPFGKSRAVVNQLAETDASGRCRFDDLPRGAQLVIDTLHPELGSFGWRPIRLGTNAQTEIRLVQPEAEVRLGRVIDADAGTPVAGAVVYVGRTLHQRIVADDQGRFRIRGWIDDPSFDLRATAPGFCTAALRLKGASDTLEVALHRAVRASGRVLDPDGAPIRGARVAAIPANEWMCACTARTDEHGRFELTGLKSEHRHTVVVVLEGFGRLVADLAVRNEATRWGDLRLERRHAVHGQFLDDAGRRIPSARIVVVGAKPGEGVVDSRTFLRRNIRHGRGWTVFTDEDGRFFVDELPSGSYLVRGHAPGVQDAVATLEVEVRQDIAHVELVAPASSPVVVTLEDQNGVPLPGVPVELEGPGGTGIVCSDATGTARLGLSGEDGLVRVRLRGDLAHRFESSGAGTRVRSKDNVRLVVRRVPWR